MSLGRIPIPRRSPMACRSNRSSSGRYQGKVRRKRHGSPASTDPRAYEDRTRSSRPVPDSSVYTLEKKPLQERDGFEVYLQLKNSGAKAIRRVDWDFMFLEPESGSELKKFSISNKSKIKSGEVRFLTKQVLPALFLGDKTRPDFARGKPAVVIRRIEFVDGSEWLGSVPRP